MNFYRIKNISLNKLMFRLAIGILLLFVFIALFATILANDKPLYVKYKGCHLFPAISFSTNYIFDDKNNGQTIVIDIEQTDWKHFNAETIIFPPVTYASGKKDMLNADYSAPFTDGKFLDNSGNLVKLPEKYRHWLGTNKRGEDVLAGLIYGTRISLMVGIFSMVLASLLGLILGSIAGYFGDHQLKTSRGRLFTTIIGIVIAWFYAFYVRTYILEDALSISGWAFLKEFMLSICIALVICFFFSFVGKYIGKLPFLKKAMNVPVDSIVSRLIEILISLPRIIIIITIAAIAKPSIINLILIIGLTSWTGIARLIRAEILKNREMDYIAACRALGYNEFRTIVKHVLPNSLAPAITAISFGVASAILIESSLSFLNIGVPPEIISWGSMLAEGKDYYNAWWLVVYPGLAIFFVVLAFNILGDRCRDYLDKRGK